jgi:hypothetical protein
VLEVPASTAATAVTVLLGLTASHTAVVAVVARMQPLAVHLHQQSALAAQVAVVTAAGPKGLVLLIYKQTERQTEAVVVAVTLNSQATSQVAVVLAL